MCKHLNVGDSFTCPSWTFSPKMGSKDYALHIYLPSHIFIETLKCSFNLLQEWNNHQHDFNNLFKFNSLLKYPIRKNHILYIDDKSKDHKNVLSSFICGYKIWKRRLTHILIVIEVLKSSHLTLHQRWDLGFVHETLDFAKTSPSPM